MPGYLNSHIESKYDDEWRYLTNVRPLIGAQSNIKYVLLGLKWARYLEMPSSSSSLPNDISDLTKMNMMSDYWENGSGIFEEEDLQELYSKYRGGIGTTKVMKLDEINDFKWDEGISEENLEKLKTEVEQKNRFNVDYLRIFKIFDEEGKYYEFNGVLQSDDEEYDLDREEVRKLILNGKLEKNSKSFVLEKKSKRELIPQSWFDLLELINRRFRYKSEDIRFILYWTH